MSAVTRLQDGEHYAERFRGSAWLLAEDEWGDLRVPSVRGRIKHGEPWWVKHYNPRNPLHWPYALWTVLNARLAYIEGVS